MSNAKMSSLFALIAWTSVLAMVWMFFTGAIKPTFSSFCWYIVGFCIAIFASLVNDMSNSPSRRR